MQAFLVDFIKIDKSFVQMASVDEISGHIVDNIVELARKPGLSIVAEGVETQEQADLMIGKGVHFLQVFAAFLLMPIPRYSLHRLRHWIALPIGFALFWHDTWLPGPESIMSQGSQVAGFSTDYLIDLVTRFINWFLNSLV